jgi:subtilase family serine protease
MRKGRQNREARLRVARRSVRIESLENRQLLSAAGLPQAYPLNSAVPLVGTLADGTSTPSAISPSTLRNVYGISNIKLNGVTGDGSGQTIAIVIANDAPGFVDSTSPNFDSSDLHIFDQQFGIPDPPSFTKVEQYGGLSADTSWSEEAALDVEWTHAIAPGANLLLLEASSSSTSGLLTWAMGKAQSYPNVSVVTMSFGFNEFSTESIYDGLFLTPSGHTGITYVASTGDQSAPGDYPAFSPNVVAVGGTTLSLSGNNYGSETGYSSSGGGISSYESKPDYQAKVTQSASNRTAPDVAFDGDPNTGVDVYDSYNGGYANKWYKIAGTSFSAPAWAALIAIADQGRVIAGKSTLDGKTQTLPTLYSLPSSDFHDITSGSNGFSAGPGYDLVTGLGTPIANLLVPALAGLNSAPQNTASISGEVYLDANDNSKLDSGESGFSGVKLYLDTNNNGVLDSGELVVTTGSSGTFTFSNLPAGTYHLREVLPSPNYWYKLTSPSSGVYNITLTAGQKVSGENFGIYKYPPGSISGYVYFDKNNDKKYDSGDTALSGVTVFLDSNMDGKLDDGEYATKTNSSGYFSFGNLPPGTYRFMEILPTGYHSENPTVGFYTVTLAGGVAMTNEDFGNVK